MSKEDNKDFIEQQIKDFKDLFIGTNIKQNKKTENADANATKCINLDPSFQGVNRLFLMAYSRADDTQATRNGQKKLI